jgi:hypothetical protein
MALAGLAVAAASGTSLPARTTAARCAALCSTHQDQPALAGSR